ncbi:hypothetical protein CYMTET_15646 [Cymbomonas tetramitiformis]|uniref:Uncharacterized protein n=1 Tax=Cymbomonas tetramitiformis TaxID=36881 RepID=A0AAE0GDN9_9CHLO|nr:hypothetical protein CYMTET_15646 [Cymbomonas tetramitiformis]
MHGGSSQREWKPPPYGQSGPGGAWVQVLLLRALNFLLADAGIRSARLPPIKAKLFKFLFKRCLAAGSPLEVQREALRCLASLADASEDTFVWDELSSNKDSLKVSRTPPSLRPTFPPIADPNTRDCSQLITPFGVN